MGKQGRSEGEEESVAQGLECGFCGKEHRSKGAKVKAGSEREQG